MESRRWFRRTTRFRCAINASASPPEPAVSTRQSSLNARRTARWLAGSSSTANTVSSDPDEDLVNALAQYLDLDVLEHQALLECDGVLARCRALIDLLEMKLHAPRDGWSGKVFH